jgi:hypothetical protein
VKLLTLANALILGSIMKTKKKAPKNNAIELNVKDVKKLFKVFIKYPREVTKFT